VHISSFGNILIAFMAKYHDLDIFCTMIGYVDGVRHLRTAATNGPIVHPPGYM
jgi:hypothetical protein